MVNMTHSKTDFFQPGVVLAKKIAIVAGRLFLFSLILPLQPTKKGYHLALGLLTVSHADEKDFV